MLNNHEIIDLQTDLNQARQAIGKIIDMSNTLANDSDFEDFQRLAKQFPELDYENFRRAIAEAMRNAKRIISEGTSNWQVNISPIPEVRSQLNLIQQALNAAKIDSTPRLEAPKPVELTGPEWLAQRFADFYNGGKVAGNFAPIWNRKVYTTGVELKAINDALRAHPEFHEGAQEIARRERANIFIGSIYTAAKVCGINTAKTWHEPGQTFQDIVKPNPNPSEPPIRTSPERDALAERIREHNATNTTKMEFDTETEYARAGALAAIHAYARLVLPQPEQPKPAGLAGKIVNIKTLEDIQP